MESNGNIENAQSVGSRVRHRLGITGLPGFAPVPHLLLLHQAELGLSPDELNVFLNIFMHWHEASRLPFVHTITIAKRMGMRHRRVQDIIRSLKKKRMIERVAGLKRSEPKRWEVRPLLKMLEPYAKSWIATKEQAAEELQRQTRRGVPFFPTQWQ